MTYKEFKTIMKDLECWKPFKANINDASVLGEFSYTKERKRIFKERDIRPHTFLITAFVWCDTPQGHKYWDRLFNKLKEKYND